MIEAQMEERSPAKAEDAGSTPVGHTILLELSHFIISSQGDVQCCVRTVRKITTEVTQQEDFAPQNAQEAFLQKASGKRSTERCQQNSKGEK